MFRPQVNESKLVLSNCPSKAVCLDENSDMYGHLVESEHVLGSTVWVAKTRLSLADITFLKTYKEFQNFLPDLDRLAYSGRCV